MKTRIFRLLAVAALAAGCTMSAASAAEEPLKVGFVYVGPVGDHGWSYEHDRARKELEKAMPGKVVTTYVENVAEGADAERVITQLAKSGNKLIFTTSFRITSYNVCYTKLLRNASSKENNRNRARYTLEHCHDKE